GVGRFGRVGGGGGRFGYVMGRGVWSVMLADSWRKRLVIGWIVAGIASLVGLFASYKLDLPTGAAIVCTCGVLLALVITFVSLRKPVHVAHAQHAEAIAAD